MKVYLLTFYSNACGQALMHSGIFTYTYISVSPVTLLYRSHLRWNINMKNFFIILSIITSQIVNSQETAWQKFSIDSNLTVELPGLVEKGPPMSIDKYSYDGVTAKMDSVMFVVMVGTSKEKIEVYSFNDYLNAIDIMAEGALNAANERHWNTMISNVTCDSVPGKKMTYSGKFLAFDAKGYNYFFLVNGLSYSMNIVFFKPVLSAKDSLTLKYFESSFDFTNDIKEMRYLVTSKSIENNSGRLVGILVILGIVIAVVLYVVRNLRNL